MLSWTLNSLMKTLLGCCVAISWLATLAAPCAAQGGAGLGIIVGEPTGLSGKAWVGGNTALDAAAAWSFADEGALHLHGDVLQHAFDLFDVERGALPLYYGIGARLKLEDQDSRFGLRVPLGLAYIFPSSRADIFMEVAPLLDLSPETEVRINGAAGVRYFFR
jgi:hypothetical protein